jgi:hypothetical protein
MVVQENQEGLKLMEHLACAGDINLVGENTDTIQRNVKALLGASKEVGLEGNPEKLMSRYQKVGQRHGII